MNATETVEEYYESLRQGDPLSSYFVQREDVVKFGLSERLAGFETISEGLREQTQTTEEWRVESHQLQVRTHDSVAWFTDDVTLEWTDSEGTRQSFETRWSGVLEQDGSGPSKETNDWHFAQMHVSAPQDP